VLSTPCGAARSLRKMLMAFSCLSPCERHLLEYVALAI
jgi:hypothetical protein